MRPVPFITNQYYHIYNRGVDKRKVFLRYGHFLRFIRTISQILQTGSASPSSTQIQSLALKSKVSILAYCLMPNHYHLLLKQLCDNGISEFMHQLNTSYTKYFNLNNNRSGRLFEYTFKGKIIESDEMLLHVSRYIHLNPLISHIVTDLELYPWSSYLEYVGLRKNTFCDLDDILDHFKNSSYKQFILDQYEYALLLKTMQDGKDEDSIFL